MQEYLWGRGLIGSCEVNLQERWVSSMKLLEGMALESSNHLAHASRNQADTRSRHDWAGPAAARDWCFLFMGAGEQRGGGMGCQERPAARQDGGSTCRGVRANSIHTQDAEEKPERLAPQGSTKNLLSEQGLALARRKNRVRITGGMARKRSRSKGSVQGKVMVSCGDAKVSQARTMGRR